MNKNARLCHFALQRTVLTVLLTLVALAGKGQIHYRIEGNIGTPDFTGWLYIQDQTEKRPKTVDSLWVQAGEIQGRELKARKPLIALLHSRDISIQFHPLFIEQGTIRMVEAPMPQRRKAFQGTPLNDEWRQLCHRADSLAQQFDEGRITKAEACRRLDNISEPLVRRHRDDLLGAYVVSTMAELGTDRLVQYVKMLSSRMQSNHIVYETVTPLLTARRTAVGKPFLDFAVEYDGQTTHLSDYVGKGKYVLLDFWASWCAPCREEIPNLIAAYNKYKDKGLEVVGVAAWDEPARTLRAIEEEKIPYPQILNSQKIATDLYGIIGIPHIILFAPDGTILARGLRGNQVGKVLDEIFEGK